MARIVIIGASIGVGPAYEMAFILDADLRKKKLRPISVIWALPVSGNYGG